MTGFRTAGAVSLLALTVGAGAALAEGKIDGAGTVAIPSNDFEALRVVNAAAAWHRPGCGDREP